jgi:hypothetical protein
VAYLPVPITAAIAPPGVVFVPVDGIPPGQVVLAWDADRPPRHIAELISAAQGVPATNEDHLSERTVVHCAAQPAPDRSCWAENRATAVAPPW